MIGPPQQRCKKRNSPFDDTLSGSNLYEEPTIARFYTSFANRLRDRAFRTGHARPGERPGHRDCRDDCAILHAFAATNLMANSLNASPVLVAHLQHAFRLGFHRQALDFVDEAFVDPDQPWAALAHGLEKCRPQFFMRGHKAVTSPRI